MTAFRMTHRLIGFTALVALSSVASAQQPQPPAEPASGGPGVEQSSPQEPAGAQDGKEAAADPGTKVNTPPGYVIGAEDVLGVIFWREKEMSGDVTVRPDGMVTLPLIHDIKAEGLTPQALSDEIQEAAGKYIQDPSVTVVVRKINSRRVFINGEVVRPGAYPLTGPMTVMQLLAIAGGLSEWADEEDIKIMRSDGEVLDFNYKDIARGENVEQNVQLRPGDTIIVP